MRKQLQALALNVFGSKWISKGYCPIFYVSSKRHNIAQCTSTTNYEDANADGPLSYAQSTRWNSSRCSPLLSKVSATHCFDSPSSAGTGWHSFFGKLFVRMGYHEDTFIQFGGTRCEHNLIEHPCATKQSQSSVVSSPRLVGLKDHSFKDESLTYGCGRHLGVGITSWSSESESWSAERSASEPSESPSVVPSSKCREPDADKRLECKG